MAHVYMGVSSLDYNSKWGIEFAHAARALNDDRTCDESSEPARLLALEEASYRDRALSAEKNLNRLMVSTKYR